MGLLDFLKGKSALEKHAERVANKRAQAPERHDSIIKLGKIAVEGKETEREAAIRGLLERFTFYVDPSITDGEEKDTTFSWICRAGEIAVDPIIDALKRHESVSWPLKCLGQLVSEERVLEEVLGVLSKMDTEYTRDPQRKLQLLHLLEERQSPKIAAVATPFFEDVNESVRLAAIRAALAQENADGVRDDLLKALAEEESVRIAVVVLEECANRGWKLGEHKDRIEMPDGFSTDAKGNVKKKS